MSVDLTKFPDHDKSRGAAVASSLSTIVGVQFVVRNGYVESTCPSSLTNLEKYRLLEACKYAHAPVILAENDDHPCIETSSISDEAVSVFKKMSEHAQYRNSRLLKGKEILSLEAGIEVEFDEDDSILVMKAGKYMPGQFNIINELRHRSALDCVGSLGKDIIIMDVDVPLLNKNMLELVHSGNAVKQVREIIKSAQYGNKGR